MENDNHKRVAVWKLLAHGGILSQMESFHEKVFKCNFRYEYKKYGMGPAYVSEHAVQEYSPTLRGVDLFNLSRLSVVDAVILTDNQWSDFIEISSRADVGSS